jgi:hypothetical protein
MRRWLVNRPKRYRRQRKHVRHPALAEANNLCTGLDLSVEQRKRGDRSRTIDHYPGASLRAKSRRICLSFSQQGSSW